VTKITCNSEVRRLLVELDEAFATFGEQSKTLAQIGLDQSTAIRVGADREAQRGIIIGVAWRINQASKGVKPGGVK
jgi:hypothetical protein